MVDIFCDGSCPANPGPGGWAFVVPHYDLQFAGSNWKTTHNQMEMVALSEAIKWCIDKDMRGRIYSDSEYCVRGWNDWMHKWSKNGWKKPKKNRDLWQEIFSLYDYFCGQVVWCPGHSGIEGNEEADALAGEQVDILVNNPIQTIQNVNNI